MVAFACLDGDRYRITAPEPVGQVDSFFANFSRRLRNGPILAGFDFPIGVPAQYARNAGITRFADALLHFGDGEWADFFSPADEARQISVFRPFYPRVPGGRKKQHLVDGLGLRSAGELLRTCDRATRTRTKACELFWTLGANQVGRAAISGWRDLLVPALRNQVVKLCPFQGELPDLLDSGKIVVAETYPAEIHSHIGFTHNFGKASREGRYKHADKMLSWCERRDIALDRDLQAQIKDGFGGTQFGEDMFDSILGLLGMIEIIQDGWINAVPQDPLVRDIEGWILGMNPNRVPTTIEGHATPLVDIVSQTLPLPTPGYLLSNTTFERLCPACERKLFARWPLGWDAHAASNCSGVAGATAEERKRIYKERYLRRSS